MVPYKYRALITVMIVNCVVLTYIWKGRLHYCMAVTGPALIMDVLWRTCQLVKFLKLKKHIGSSSFVWLYNLTSLFVLAAMVTRFESKFLMLYFLFIRGAAMEAWQFTRRCVDMSSAVLTADGVTTQLWAESLLWLLFVVGVTKIAYV